MFEQQCLKQGGLKAKGYLRRLTDAVREKRQDNAVVLRCRLYLTGRRTQITYARFAVAGYPLGSGTVESANKLLAEARLKGSGMHWVRLDFPDWLEEWIVRGEIRNSEARGVRNEYTLLVVR